MGDTSRSTHAVEGAGVDHVLVRQFSVRVIEGPDTGLSHSTRGDRVVIGTHRSSHFLLTDPTLSRFHCQIALEDGRPVVRDLGSRNGTFVDGVPVREAPLRQTATLVLGRSHLRFEVGSGDVKIPISERSRFGMLVGRSQAMRAVFLRLEQAAASDAPVLLLGETGTGKDAAAESIHQESARKDRPFVVVDCGAISPNLVESELFGHERGAFTGAERTRIGALEAADGGTLFLDEVGELAVDLQPKLLRVVERRELQRVGGSERRRVDVRIVAATNRDLKADVNARRFRADLYYRLAVLEIVLPPLRQRLDDLPLLVEALLESRGAADDPAAATLRMPEFLASLSGHGWHGNVRELRNHLATSLALGAPPAPQAQALSGPTADSAQPLHVAQDRFLRAYLHGLLERHGGNASQAARAAGIARSQLYRLMGRLGLR